MIRLWVLSVSLCFTAAASAASLRDRLMPVLPDASMNFARAVDQLDATVRAMARGHSWARSDQLKRDYGAFVFNLRRQTSDLRTQTEVMVRFAEFCRDEASGSVAEVVEVLGSRDRHKTALRAATQHPREAVDLRASDVVTGAVQAATGMALTVITVPLIPLMILAPLVSAMSGDATTPADENSWSTMFMFVGSSLQMAADGFSRVTGRVPAKTLMKTVKPNSALVRVTCDTLLKPQNG